MNNNCNQCTQIGIGVKPLEHAKSTASGNCAWLVSNSYACPIDLSQYNTCLLALELIYGALLIIHAWLLLIRDAITKSNTKARAH